MNNQITTICEIPSDYDLFSVIENNFSIVNSFFKKVLENYNNISNKFLINILKNDFQNLELKIFIKILFFLSGILVFFFLCSFVNQIDIEINGNFEKYKLKSVKINKIIYLNSILFKFYFWSSTLFLLIKSNKYNIFVK